MKKEFHVATDSMVEFADLLAEHDLNNEILGSTENDQVIVSVQFDKNDFEAVEELEESFESEQEDEE